MSSRRHTHIFLSLLPGRFLSPVLIPCLVSLVGLATLVGSASQSNTENLASPVSISKTSALAQPAGTPACGLAWRVVPSPNVSTIHNYLLGVAGSSADDIWAVGSQEVDATGTLGTLAL